MQNTLEYFERYSFSQPDFSSEQQQKQTKKCKNFGVTFLNSPKDGT